MKRLRKCYKDFSIHASSREDATTSEEYRLWESWFQSTRPRGRTRHPRTIILGIRLRFNPRVLAGGRDQLYLRFRGLIPVSIHASSREDAT